MAYQKRRSTTLEKAQTRLRGLHSVHPTLDLGNGLTLQGYADLIEASVTQLQTHNLGLAEADRTRIEFALVSRSFRHRFTVMLSMTVNLWRKLRDTNWVETPSRQNPYHSYLSFA